MAGEKDGTESFETIVMRQVDILKKEMGDGSELL